MLLFALCINLFRQIITNERTDRPTDIYFKVATIWETQEKLKTTNEKQVPQIQRVSIENLISIY